MNEEDANFANSFAQMPNGIPPDSHNHSRVESHESAATGAGTNVLIDVSVLSVASSDNFPASANVSGDAGNAELVDGQAAPQNGASQNSSFSDADYVRFGQDELAEIPADLLMEYGNRMAYDVLSQITNGNASMQDGSAEQHRHHRQHELEQQQEEELQQQREERAAMDLMDVSTPLTDELASPISNFTERDYIMQNNDQQQQNWNKTVIQSPNYEDNNASDYQHQHDLRQTNQHHSSNEPDLMQFDNFAQNYQQQVQPLSYERSEFDPLAGRTSSSAEKNQPPPNKIGFEHHFESQTHGGSLRGEEYKPQPNYSTNFNDFEEIHGQNHPDRPEVVPIGESDSMKDSSTDSDLELVVEPVPNNYEKPVETGTEAQPKNSASHEKDHGEVKKEENQTNKDHHHEPKDETIEFKEHVLNRDDNIAQDPDELRTPGDIDVKNGIETSAQLGKKLIPGLSDEKQQAGGREQNEQQYRGQFKEELPETYHRVNTTSAESKKEDEEYSDQDDTLASLPGESKAHDNDAQSPKDERIPESSSITGMRDFTADGAEDEEALIQARGGRPLVIPPKAMSATVGFPADRSDDSKNDEENAEKPQGAEHMSQKTNAEEQPQKHKAFANYLRENEPSSAQTAREDAPTYDEKEPFETAKWPVRPPTPPKSLENSDEEAEKPSVMDLGPPPPSHNLPHRTSVSGLHSILKQQKDKAWITSVTDPRILDLVYWRDPKRSGIALAVSLAALYLFSQCTVLSVFAYLALAVLFSTIGFRVFKLVEGRMKNIDGSNPFKPYLEEDVVVPQEKLHAQVEVFVEHAQTAFKHLRHLFLVENLVDSVKFGLLLYTLTYIGAWFSGLTLLFFFVVGLFTVPKIYEMNKQPIDNYLALAQENLEKVQHAVEDKLPFLRKQVEAEKKEH